MQFKKIIIKKTAPECLNTEYVAEIISLFEQFSRYLYDDYFADRSATRIIALIEATSPYFWAIVEEKTGVLAGFVFLENLIGDENNLHSAEVTTCFKPQFWGAYTKTAAKKFVRYCFKKYKLKKLKATIFPQNFKVKAILKSAGFKKEAVLKAETLKNGVLQDIEVFSIIKKTRK